MYRQTPNNNKDRQDKTNTDIPPSVNFPNRFDSKCHMLISQMCGKQNFLYFLRKCKRFHNEKRVISWFWKFRKLSFIHVHNTNRDRQYCFCRWILYFPRLFHFLFISWMCNETLLLYIHVIVRYFCKITVLVLFTITKKMPDMN